VATYLEMKNKLLSTRIKKRIFRHINILNWLPHYNKQDGIGDLIAGITVGLTMMPQSIAYASLAGLSPQVRSSADYLWIQKRDKWLSY
jgi:sodium-independent sulfate anion transporter 11